MRTAEHWPIIVRRWRNKFEARCPFFKDCFERGLTRSTAISKLAERIAAILKTDPDSWPLFKGFPWKIPAKSELVLLLVTKTNPANHPQPRVENTSRSIVGLQTFVHSMVPVEVDGKVSFVPMQLFVAHKSPSLRIGSTLLIFEQDGTLSHIGVRSRDRDPNAKTQALETLQQADRGYGRAPAEPWFPKDSEEAAFEMLGWPPTSRDN